VNDAEKAKTYAFNTTLLILRLQAAALVAHRFATREQFVGAAGTAFDEVCKMQDEAERDCLARLEAGKPGAKGGK